MGDMALKYRYNKEHFLPTVAPTTNQNPSTASSWCSSQ